MQGNWTVKVKSKSASFPQRFIITGATSGNGVYDGDTSTAAVNVTGYIWSIAIQNDAGHGFQLSDTRIKFPTLSGSDYVFDIQSNDAGNDLDFNDLILTCSTPAMSDDFIIYGNVSLYSGLCRFNPCFRRYIVIDTYAQLLRALEIDVLRNVITKYYPERIPLKIPNPPDPSPFFTPMVINLGGEVQLPDKAVNLLRPNEASVNSSVNSSVDSSLYETRSTNELPASDFTFEKRITLSNIKERSSSTLSSVNLLDIARLVDNSRFGCNTEAAINFTLNFAEYNRTAAELAGGPYTGGGNRTPLGAAITDMNGNYIFRFKQTLSELINEILYDVAPGENYLVQALPDIIISITDSLHPNDILFESAPYFNVQHMKQVNICLPKEKVPPTSLCFNGNLIGSLGNVFIGGDQNTNGNINNVDRLGYDNHLRPEGTVSVHSSLAGFNVDCAAWEGSVDMKGCMYNLQRKPNDPLIENYTIRFSTDGVNWQFVYQAYSQPRFSHRFLPNYTGDPVGPFYISVNVDGTPQVVPTYMNIQKQAFFDGVDWEFSNLDRYMQLNTTLYDGIGHAPRKVYIKVEGYDSGGNLVSEAVDLIAMYLHNQPIDYSISSVAFTNTIEELPCGLYKMTDAEMNTPLDITFIAQDNWGFLNGYELGISKCPAPIEVDITAPLSIVGTVTDGDLKTGINAANIDNMVLNDNSGCPGYRGTPDDFGTSGSVTVTLQPAATMGGWLRSGELFGVISIGLSVSIRKTNGYNSGIDAPTPAGTSFYIERK